GNQHLKVSAACRRNGKPRSAAARGVGLQPGCFDAYAGDAYLPAAAEDREGPLACAAAADGKRRVSAQSLAEVGSLKSEVRTFRVLTSRFRSPARQRLFVAQRFDGVEASGTARGEKAEGNSDRCGDDERQRHNAG